jgi:hypothetical protein
MADYSYREDFYDNPSEKINDAKFIVRGVEGTDGATGVLGSAA